MQKLWNFLPQPDESKVLKLADELGINVTLVRLLAQRGIETYDEAKTFFRPTLADLHDPFLMKDMDLAVARILEALENEERILIYGDYDVDGTTSVTLVYKYLKKYHTALEYYIPDRYAEGYGVSTQGIEWAKEHGVGLIISLDCGINAFEPISLAKSYDIDFIVCDHHRPAENLPEAVAVLDPKRSDCDYPFKELSGCGVGFKLLQALTDNRHDWPEEELYNLLDLVAVSIAADIVPITGENRTLAHFGLKQLNQKPQLGLEALINVAGMRPPLNITNVVFGLAPRINAAGRMAHAHGALDLLLSEDEKEAAYLSTEVNSKNVIRREEDQGITSEAIQMIEADEVLSRAKTTVLFKEHWHKGVIGIVASKCIEHFHRPTIILTESNGKATGSARSVPGFDIHEAIGACSELLEQFGGHKYAAGLTLSTDKVLAFQEKFEEVVAATISEEQLTPKINIDQELTLDQISDKFYGIISQMEPFGPGNMSPVFVARGLIAVKHRLLKGLHLKLSVGHLKGGPVFDAIGFNMPESYDLISEGNTFDLAFSVEENNFRGNKTLQLNIKDIKFEKNGRA